jgi:hypothetical protein
MEALDDEKEVVGPYVSGNVFVVPKLSMVHALWDTLQGPQVRADITESRFKNARKKLRLAFVEFYRALELLETYRY